MQTDEISTMEPAGISIGNVHEFLESAASSGRLDSCRGMLSGLLKEHETIIASLRKNIHACNERTGRTGTTSFLATLLEQHEAIVDILMRYMNKTISYATASHCVVLQEVYDTPGLI